MAVSSSIRSFVRRADATYPVNFGCQPRRFVLVKSDRCHVAALLGHEVNSDTHTHALSLSSSLGRAIGGAVKTAAGQRSTNSSDDHSGENHPPSLSLCACLRRLRSGRMLDRRGRVVRQWRRDSRYTLLPGHLSTLNDDLKTTFLVLLGIFQTHVTSSNDQNKVPTPNPVSKSAAFLYCTGVEN